MNRIILIGNGFDKAHGMPTSYAEFIDNYYKEFASNLPKAYVSFENEDLKVSINAEVRFDKYISQWKIESYKEFKEWMGNYSKFSSRGGLTSGGNLIVQLDYKNHFLKVISETSGLKKWVDIEEEYYKLLTGKLKSSYQNNSYIGIDAEAINKDLESIKKSLEEYLTEVENEYLSHIAIVQIRDKIYSKFKLEDLSSKYRNEYYKEIKNKLFKSVNITQYRDVYKNLSFIEGRIERFIKDYSLDTLDEDKLKEYIKVGYTPDYYLVPNNILFLSFNYTHTEKKYIVKSPLVNTIHIHGEVNSLENPMIFGYGDEIGEEYQRLENLKDDEVLKNMKSVRYLDTDNYKRLLDFIESEPYQIFIMGHSCGTSDRTLLNTLFEHENCASIKPFYHQISEKEDNYSNIIQGISRNFKDKPSMRDKVVNRTQCEPLVAFKS